MGAPDSLMRRKREVLKMSDPKPQTWTDDQTLGRLDYVAGTAESSLFRNGKVRMSRDADGSDASIQGVDLDPRRMPIQNARRLPNDRRPALESHGFELLDRPSGRVDLNFLDQQKIIEAYYPECGRIVGAAVGARAIAFDHNVRSALGKKSLKQISGGQSVQAPLHMVHGDYTLAAEPQRLRGLANQPGSNDTLRTVLSAGESRISQAQVARALAAGGRFAIVNLWRNIGSEPVSTHPLTLCDSRSIDPEDLVVFEIHYPDRIGENYFAKHADRHRWTYYAEMTGNEALLIKQWDSAGTLPRSNGRSGDADDAGAPSTFSFDSAFDGPAAPPDAPDRKSIEVRCVVLYD